MAPDARPDGRTSPQEDPTGEPDTGRHTLGPYVVGQRVVVRRLVRDASGEIETGPTGGPAMTDVLGECESWPAGPGATVVVRREDGERVRIPTGDIVSGKPVPPRPSPRLRVDARTAEGHARVLWPHVERVPLGEWELRTEAQPIGRSRKRANSCLAMGDPGLPPAEAVAAVAEFYAARERPAIAQVEADSPQEQAFADAGWAHLVEGEAAYLLAPVARTLRLLRGHGERAQVEGDELVTAEVRLGAEVVASGQSGLDGDWVGVHGLHVLPTRRRQGLAQEVMAGLLERAAEQGATTAWLHVEVTNAPALALYERLGFTEHHRLRYWQV